MMVGTLEVEDIEQLYEAVGLDPDYKVIRKKNDTGWKIVLEAFLPDFVCFCFPELAKKIDWSRQFQSLDAELHAITKEAKQGARIVDKLFKVYLLDGGEKWVLIHIEVQGKPEEDLPERMFVTSYRIYDRYTRPLLSCAILTDNNENWRPDRFEVNFEGSSLSIKYHVIKLIDYRTQIEELENSSNPFAQVILVQLAAMEAKKKTPEVRYNLKTALTRRLRKKGLNKNQITKLYYFIDWLITLPEQYEIQYKNECIKLDKGEEMGYISAIEYLGMKEGFKKGMLEGLEKGRLKGRQEGRQEGRQKGEAALLIRQLTLKFKRIPDHYLQKIEQADAETLLLWGERILAVEAIEEIFK